MDAAIQLAKAGQLQAARTLLSVPASVTDQDLLAALQALAEGLTLFRQDRHQDAAQHLAVAAAILKASTDVEVAFVIEMVKNLSDGIARLAYGDAHGAMALLDLGAEQTRRLAFFYPELENIAVKAKALSYLAIARAFVILGDLGQARQWFAKADQEHSRFLELLQNEANADPLHFAAVYCTRLELALLMFRVDLEGLDLESAERFLRDSVHDQANLERHLQNAPDTLNSRVMRAVAAVMKAAHKLLPVAGKVIANRRVLARADVADLKTVDDLLFEARELAIEGGQLGAGYLYMITQLQRFRLNLLKVGSVTTADFGRLGGPVTAGTLVVLVTTIHLTFAPSGILALGFFFGSLVVSLVAGFGYGALRFKPLLELIRKEIRRAEGDKAPG
jgi:hypothetical protein